MSSMLSCGHDREPFGEPRCAHLATANHSYFRYYLGHDLDAELLCRDCDEARKADEGVATHQVCRECHERLLKEEDHALGVRGAPGIRVRELPFPTVVRETVLPKHLGAVLALAPLPDGGASAWWVLAEGMTLFRLEAETGAAQPLCPVTLPPDDSEPWGGHRVTPALHASPCGNFVAVVNDHGRFGQILDARTGERRLALDGGDHHQETVPFSFAFIPWKGRTLAIHRTEWNRLDVVDPATGETLTPRGPTRIHPETRRRPVHYLDYFQGALYPSPDHRHLLVDGWVWHPDGIPAVFSVERWLSGHVWEAEDGESRGQACYRAYFWNGPMAWLDDTTVAIGGIGEDGDEMLDGARLFDITQKTPTRWLREIRTIPGPAGRFFGHGGLLYSADATGLARWDPVDGARTGWLSGFCPTHFHHGSREFAGIRDGRLVRVQLAG
jgi:hypothetical protein